MSKLIYQQQITELTDQLKTNIQTGLSETEAAERLASAGPNTLREKEKTPLWRKLLAQFNDVMVLILIGASVVSGFLGEWIDAAVILAIVIINAVLGLIQEGRAEKAIDALRKMTSPLARVIRDGAQKQIDAANLVPGDLVLIEAGDIVPADLRLIESTSLKADESSLTGESVPVEKDAAREINEEVGLGDRTNLLYMNTPVTYGRGRGLVTSTGHATEIGKIAEQLQDIEDEATPLQKNLNKLGKILGIIVLAVCAIVLAQGLLSGGAFLPVFMTSVSLAVAAIPEGLPAVVTIVLALGMRRMAERNAIVKRLLAVETLGSVDVICSDKTGTLTQNAMTVTRMIDSNGTAMVEGTGYATDGDILNQATGQQAKYDPADLRLLQIGVLCNDAALVIPRGASSDQSTGLNKILGDPTEAALLVAGAKAGMEQEELQKIYPRLSDLPFDSERKMMTTVHSGFPEAPKVSLTKGAPDIVLARCDTYAAPDPADAVSDPDRQSINIQPLTEEARKAVLEANNDLASQALRVLAFACKAHPGEVVEPEQGMTFIGLMGMIDPARPEAREAIALCHSAGIRAIMITGDYRETAVAIARDLGMMDPDDEFRSGADLDRISDEDLRDVVENTAVYARVSPNHKVRIVTALRQNGHIASMTGDGVNDAMALKTADIGVAMGITGTDVAKGSADMILTDDNFATIVDAVREGRIIYSNIRKFVGFLLSCNVGEILVIFITSLLMGPNYAPLAPIQLLWLNLVTDSFPALALGQERGEPDIMQQKPRKIGESILNKDMTITIVTQAIAIFAAVFAAYQIGLARYGSVLVDGHSEPSHGAKTFAFVTLILAELFRSFSARSERNSVFRLGLFSNASLNKGVLISVALTLAVIYVPFLDPIFKTIAPSAIDWLVILPLALIPFVVAELVKWLRRPKNV